MKALISSLRRHLPSSPQPTQVKTNQPIQSEATATAPTPEVSGGDDQIPNDRAVPHESDTRPLSPARKFPQSGFGSVTASQKLEEEGFSWYSPKTWYPARIGEVLQGTYQIVAKLGYGTASTTWLCRDLRKHRYVTVKIYAVDQDQRSRELAALKHINSVLADSSHSEHTGSLHVRTLLDQFDLSHPKSAKRNVCLVFVPLGMSLGDTRKIVYKGRMPVDVVKGAVVSLLKALDFLHREANLVHADMQEDNVMLSLGRDTDLRKLVEEAEMQKPCPRKLNKDHIIYASRLLKVPGTKPVLCDFGEARFGEAAYGEHVMPDLYRAPEIIFQIEWNEKIDIWALGLVTGKLWTLIQGTNLFNNNQGGRWKSAAAHIGRMVTLLGPPPQDLLDMTPRSKLYFDKTGRFKKASKLAQTSLEAEATALEGAEKAEFLRFLRRLLHWDQDERPSASELLKDPWLALPSNSNVEGNEDGVGDEQANKGETVGDSHDGEGEEVRGVPVHTT